MISVFGETLLDLMAHFVNKEYITVGPTISLIILFLRPLSFIDPGPICKINMLTDYPMQG